VGGDADVLFDIGICRGSDAIVALALGADAIMLGRPYVYELAFEGADGLRAIGQDFTADLDLTRGLSGTAIDFQVGSVGDQGAGAVANTLVRDSGTVAASQGS